MIAKTVSPLVPLYDKGKNLVCFCTEAQVERYADQPFTTTVRARNGRILRIIFCDPAEETRTETQSSAGKLPVGQSYSYQEQLNDTIYRPWTLRRSTALQPSLILSALEDCGAQLRVVGTSD